MKLSFLLGETVSPCRISKRPIADLNPVKVKAEEQSVLEFKNLATVRDC